METRPQNRETERDNISKKKNVLLDRGNDLASDYSMGVVTESRHISQ